MVSCFRADEFDCCGVEGVDNDFQETKRKELVARGRRWYSRMTHSDNNLEKGYTPAHTNRSTEWAINKFSHWLKQQTPMHW